MNEPHRLAELVQNPDVRLRAVGAHMREVLLTSAREAHALEVTVLAYIIRAGETAAGDGRAVLGYDANAPEAPWVALEVELPEHAVRLLRRLALAFSCIRWDTSWITHPTETRRILRPQEQLQVVRE